MAEEENYQPQESQESASEIVERNRQNKEKWLFNQSRTILNDDKGHTLQDVFREWFDIVGTISEANRRISQQCEPDKYTANAGKSSILQEQMLTWLDGLERDDQDKDRSR